MMRPAAGSPLLRGAALLARPAPVPGSILALALAVALCLPALLRPIDRAGDAVTPQAALAAASRLGVAGPGLQQRGVWRGSDFFRRPDLYRRPHRALRQQLPRGLSRRRARRPTAVLAGLLDRYHIAWTLLQAQSPAVAALDRLPGWRRAYADGEAVIHVRAD